MGFRNGSGSEKLLNCSACNEPMALDAEFCSDCGVRRAIATGYEAETEQFESTGGKFKSEVLKKFSGGVTNLGGTFENGKERLTAGFSNLSRIKSHIREKLSQFNKFLASKRKIIYLATGGMFVLASYVLTQTIIFNGQNTDSFSEKYINLVSARDSSEVKANSIYFPNPENLPILPVKFQKWDDIEQITWKTDSNWNGWLGKATVTFAPLLNQKVMNTETIEIQLAAKFKTKWFIFREIDWVASNPIASIDLDSNIERDQTITFNGASAGNSNSPLLNKKKYAILPGPISIVLNGSGFTKEREYSTFASSAGLLKSEFESIGYGLSPAQQSSASNRVISDFENCLKRECGRLPNLYQSDFYFDNWPDSYLYVDYFNPSWDDSYTCEPADFTVSSYQSAQISMKCSVYASASIKWILYRVWFTTYYDIGFDYKELDVYLTADLSPLTGSSSVRVSGISFGS
jgi:hypothetical protein